MLSLSISMLPGARAVHAPVDNSKRECFCTDQLCLFLLCTAQAFEKLTFAFVMCVQAEPTFSMYVQLCSGSIESAQVFADVYPCAVPQTQDARANTKSQSTSIRNRNSFLLVSLEKYIVQTQHKCCIVCWFRNFACIVLTYPCVRKGGVQTHPNSKFCLTDPLVASKDFNIPYFDCHRVSTNCVGSTGRTE